MQHEISDIPWHNIGSDTFEYDGKIYFLVIDYYSKFIETCRIRNKQASSVIFTLRSISVRHGIPQTFMTDNILYNPQEFKSFSNQYNFILITSSPNYTQSNGLSKMRVKIVKRIFKKCKDPYLGLLEYNNTSITGMSSSPSQLLMSQSAQSLLPVHNSTLKPAIPNNVKNEVLLQKQKQESYYDQTSNHYHPSKKEKSLKLGTNEYGTKLVQRVLQELQKNPML